MKKLLSMALVLMLVLGCAAMAMAEGEYISVISKGEQHAFWQAVRKGCDDAQAEYGIEMYYYGPPSEKDIALQVEALKGEMAKNPVAIALAALDTESVLTELQECIEKGIPVIGFDSGVPNAPEGAIYANASTDNEAAAALAAEKMMEAEGFKEKLEAATADAPVVIAVLSQDAVGDSIVKRTTGFVNKMTELAGEIGVVSVEGHSLWANEASDATIIIRVEVSATPEDSDVTNTANAMMNLDNLYAIFCSNEGAVNGLLNATNDGSDFGEGGRYDGIVVAGFDAGQPQKDAIRQGWFYGSVTQDPYMIGYLAVELAVKAANGEEITDIDTGAHWYNAENIDDPEIALLVYD